MADNIAPDPSAPPQNPTQMPGATQGSSNLPDTAPQVSGPQAPQQGFFGRAASGLSNAVMHPIQAAQAAEQATFGHDALVGKAAKSLLGTQTSYQAQPDGTIKQVPVPQAPGDLFRHILAGVLLGGAAGGQAKGGFVGGLAAGGGAGVENNQKQDQVKFGQAETDFKNQQETQKNQQDNLFRQAQIAHMTAEDMRADSTMDFARQEHLDKMNSANGVIEATAQEKGALANVPVGGKNINNTMGNGAQLADLYKKDPSLGQAPKGFHRVHTQNVDASGLTYKQEAGPDGKPIQGWFDKDDKQVDMDSRTTHALYDIPDSIWGQTVHKDGAELNKAGHTDMFTAGKDYAVSNGDLFTLKTKGTEETNKATEATVRLMLARSQVADTSMKIKLMGEEFENGKNSPDRQDMTIINDQLNNTQKQLHDVISSGTGDPVQIKDLTDYLAAGRQKMQDLQDKIDGKPATGGVKTRAAGATSIDPARVDTNVIAGALKAVSTMPLADQINAIQTSTKLSDAEKKRLQEQLQSTASQTLGATGPGIRSAAGSAVNAVGSVLGSGGQVQ